ncbi:PREDICTED: nephrin-like, partial [Nicrophorus vespilloides]|uniref:Nephrin-like n=1 Tax=Nicrophorus vespilloides TaxID=110193 RepID=A0ABM1M8H4_NICVS
PPQGVQVSDDRGPIKNGITTAYAEGASLTLTCSATSGKPLARVSWWKGGELITNETQYFPERKRSQSILKIDKLIRSHLLAVFSCEVSNSQLQPPLVVRVAIDMYLRPLEARLQGLNHPLSAGRRTDITCKCKGSRPPAVISWWK